MYLYNGTEKIRSEIEDGYRTDLSLTYTSVLILVKYSGLFPAG